jgi:predicted ABC-class ATPase
VRALNDLVSVLLSIDGKGYGAYKQIVGAWEGDGITLFVDHVQQDPFAAPSRIRLRIPQDVHGIPMDLWHGRPRKMAVEDYLLRTFARAARSFPRGEGSGRSGEIRVDAGGAEMLERTGCELRADALQLRFRVGLPAAGRSILGRKAADLLADRLPEAARTVWWANMDREAVRAWADLAEDHAALQEELPRRKLVAFVRDGSILPRASGVSQQPLADAVPFVSPESMRVTLSTRHHGQVSGMGIAEGVTLVTGGGFHGKTTLLEALQRGVYPHVPGDGREWVVTRFGAVKVRSEDGRAVTGVDVRPFIDQLPGGKATSTFSTQDASGSTSLAAAILESIEVGAEMILLDEDTCSSNLLVQDELMQTLIRKETITPLIDRARELHDTLGVSILLVVGGSGDYLTIADRVVLMEDYLPRDATEEAHRIAREHPPGRSRDHPKHPLRVTARAPLPQSFNPRGRQRERVKARGLRELVYGEDTIDLTALEQLVDDSQVRAIGELLRRCRTLAHHGRPLRDLVRELFSEIDRQGLYGLAASPELAMPRPFDVAGAINRLRGLVIEQIDTAGERADPPVDK